MCRIYLLGIFLLLTGCAVTDQGKKPTPVAGKQNVYQFNVYFSIVDKQEVQAYAENAAAKLAKEKKCASYQLEDFGHKLWLDRYYVYHASLSCE